MIFFIFSQIVFLIQPHNPGLLSSPTRNEIPFNIKIYRPLKPEHFTDTILNNIVVGDID